MARNILAIARGGLDRRNRLDAQGQSESRYLAPLDEIAESGKTPADVLLARFSGPWQGSVDPAFTDCAY